MSEFKLFNSEGKKFEILIYIELNDKKEIISEEYSNGIVSKENPSDLINFSYFCDDEDFEGWNNFFTDFMYLYESREIYKKIKILKNQGDSYFFDDENITVERL